ncbi:hypothetical protein DL766_002431 [Monosporascus sp. MC13-8B]|uniref:Transcription initiation factor TFIID subunit 8 n=1 Tax=Monosporascus cannonballus TaxID=155416 RepID=A0ABY0GVH1_9PEZI|nr:hypothetical protein DL762_008669 [Monosporascus cannonballus]RYO90704.1 hypothetical protein DL763_005243 [Monosporascus cannonballus]RYP35574.1 hypothetical protein DL766_002431 [Monosporascus sp. MC13-8B]
MEGTSRKRAATGDANHEQLDRAKRQRTATLESEPELSAVEEPTYEVTNRPTAEDVGLDGLRRSIVLALQHVGFESATKEALESFTGTVDTYMSGFIGQLKRTAHAARRENPTPADFETVLRRYNIPTSSLKPHLKNPVPKKQLSPKTYDPITEDISALQSTETPRFLGPELDGNLDKQSREWIPESFPGFPSKHTYKFTPVEVPAPDKKKKRAEALADTRKAEQALGRIDRAGKISRHKELKEMADRDPLSKQRHQGWEEVMRAYLPKKDGSKDGSTGSLEIADFSTIVNAGARYLRQEAPKASRRNQSEAVPSQG